MPFLSFSYNLIQDACINFQKSIETFEILVWVGVSHWFIRFLKLRFYTVECLQLHKHISITKLNLANIYASHTAITIFTNSTMCAEDKHKHFVCFFLLWSLIWMEKATQMFMIFEFHTKFSVTQTYSFDTCTDIKVAWKIRYHNLEKAFLKDGVTSMSINKVEGLVL